MKYMYLNIAFRRKDTVAKRKYNKSACVCVCLVFSIESRREIFEFIPPIVYSFLPII